VKTLNQLDQVAKRRYVSGYSFALAYARLGDRDQAFQSLERAFQDRAQEMTRLKVDPLLDSLRTDSRFADLLRRVGLAQ